MNDYVYPYSAICLDCAKTLGCQFQAGGFVLESKARCPACGEETFLADAVKDVKLFAVPLFWRELCEKARAERHKLKRA